MKRILIVNNNLHIGGVQKALVNLLWEIRDEYDITLLLFYPDGEYRKELPPQVRVQTVTSGYRYFGLSKYDTVTVRSKLGRSFYAAITRLFGRKHAVRLMALGQKPLTGYDIAISYLHNGPDKAFYGGCNEFVLRHVKAKKKIAFLHCDYLHSGSDTPQNAKAYARFDAIAACSKGCAESFIAANPALADRVTVVYNCQQDAYTRKSAQQDPQQLQTGKCNIVTVARLGREKSVERALLAIAQLGALKEKLHYYVIGDGIGMPLLRELKQQLQLEDCVTLCGARENPYGYIQAADLLLIPSVSEGAPMVIREAACLGTPILSTETSSAKELIAERRCGWVCENSVEGIAAGLRSLLEDPHAWMGKPMENAYIPDNAEAIRQFHAVLEA